MKNSYWAAIVVLLIIVLGLLLVNRKSEAPVEKIENTGVVNVSFEDGNYKLNTELSKIGWTGEKITGSLETGTVKLESGNFKVKNGSLAEGVFDVDMRSIDSNPHSDLLVKHLKSADFFDIANYPTARFLIKQIIPTSEEGAKLGNYVILGDLTIKSTTKPLAFIANFQKTEKGLKATASFALNRTDWEIKYNSPTFFQNLGDKFIRDAILIELDLQSEKVIE